MNKEEIKEILNIERYRNKDGYVENIKLLPEEIHKLKDYITNLQEENERLNNQLDFIGEQNRYIDKLEYKIKKIVYSCYESDMSYVSFKEIWINAFGKSYDPKDIDKLENELKVGDKE